MQKISQSLALPAGCLLLTSALLLGGCTKSANQPSSGTTSEAPPAPGPSEATDAAKEVAKPEAGKSETAASTPVPAAPAFDMGVLGKNIYQSDHGVRLLFLRDQRVEMRLPHAPTATDKAKWQIVRGTEAKAVGDHVVFKVDGGGERSLAVQDGGKKLVGAEPAETFTQQKAVSPDGSTYVKDSGVIVRFKGKTATFTDPKDKKSHTANDVKYTADTVSYTDGQGKGAVVRTLSIDSGGMRLTDVTPAQTIAIYTLQEAD